MNKNIQKDNYCQNINDHREIGKDQKLFSFHKEGPGFPFFHPNGLILKNLLIDYWRREHHQAGYDEIESPMMLNKDLWIQSGHWELFRENMYVSEVDKGEFAIKPMNCPGAMLYFQEEKKSFKDLPKRICELGKVHRNEVSGALHGLLRARSFIIDDAHIFCCADQLKSEIHGVISLCIKMLNDFGFVDLIFELSVRNKEKHSKYLGNEQDWVMAEQILIDVLIEKNIKFKKMEGEAKFYGPAIDIKINDSLGKQWQCSSIQFDFNLAQRFNLHYFDKNNQKQIPYILHRCVFGSLERFIGMLLEHYKGHLPFLLSPVQIKILSVNQDVIEYANSFSNWLEKNNFRHKLDLNDENLSSKIKKAWNENIPVVVIIGNDEVKEQKISLRFYNGKIMKLISREEILKI